MPETVHPLPPAPTTAPDAHPTGDRLEVADVHRELLAQVLDTWSIQVLAELCERPSRFNELRRAIPAVTQKSLTATLRRLERNGVVERVVLRTRPVAIQYSITPLGKTFREPVDALLAWTTTHLPAVERARERFDDEQDAEDADPWGAPSAAEAPAGASTSAAVSR